MELYALAIKVPLYSHGYTHTMLVIRKLKRIDGTLYWTKSMDEVASKFRRKHKAILIKHTEETARQVAEEEGLFYIGRIPSNDRLSYNDYPLGEPQ